jgi:hypothetical protein
LTKVRTKPTPKVRTSDDEDPNDDSQSGLGEGVEDPLTRFSDGVLQKSLDLLRCDLSVISDLIELTCLISSI